MNKRETLDFNSLPAIIKEMTENNSVASKVIDSLIENKGESNTLAILILLDDMNIRGKQLELLYQMTDENIDKLYDKILNIKLEDIKKLNELSAPLCIYKAVYDGTSLERKENSEKYLFTDKERESIIKHKENNQNKDLYPNISIKKALEILKEKGFKCGYKKEYINKHSKEIYYIFYDKYDNILSTIALENKDLFLGKDSKLIKLKENSIEEIDLKDNILDLNELSKEKNYTLLPVIKTVKGILYKEKTHTYSSCITAYIYDLLSFEKTYNELDNHLKEIYKPLLEIAEDKAYDEIINHLKVEDGIEIAINLQNILGYSLDNSKLIKAKDRFYKSLGYNPTKQKRFLSRLVSNEPYTKDMNKKIIEVLEKDIETV